MVGSREGAMLDYSDRQQDANSCRDREKLVPGEKDQAVKDDADPRGTSARLNDPASCRAPITVMQCLSPEAVEPRGTT